jgi:uncharacterized protein (TIGR03437 family)
MFAMFILSTTLWGQECDTGVTFQGPIRITQGGTYTGNWQSTDSSVPAVRISTTAPVSIVNSRVKGPGELIAAGSASRIKIQNSCFVGSNPNVAGTAKGSPIHAFQAASVDVENCDFLGGGYYGIWIQQYGGDHTLNDTIRIVNNRIRNVDGRFSDGRDGYQTSPDNGGAHGIILSSVNGVPGIEIAWNEIVNQPGQSGGNPDSVNIYESGGTLASPASIHDNYFQGSYAADPGRADALGFVGSDFTTDGTAQTDPALTTSYLRIHHNQAVSTGNVGMSIAIGHDIEMYSNRVISSGQIADGTNISASYSTGLDHWDWRYPPPVAPPANFGNNSVHDNVSGLRRQRNGAWERADFYIPVTPAVSGNNTSWTPSTPDAPTLTDEANERLLWNEKLLLNGVTIGSSLIPPALQGSVQIVSGNNQVAAPGESLPAPVSIRVVTTGGAPVSGVSVAFSVITGNATADRHFAVTDPNGVAGSTIVLGSAPAAVQVTASAIGYAPASLRLWIQQPPSTVAGGGVVGAGDSVPAVRTLSQNALFSIYGQNFLPAGATGRRVLAGEFVNGGLPDSLLGVCVDVGGQRAAMLDVYPTQINAQAPAMTGTSTTIRVLTNCGTPAEAASVAQTITVAAASPEFLYFQLNVDGRNPVVLVNALTGALMGPANLFGGLLTPARAGDVLTAYATGFGLVTPPVATGQFPQDAARAVGAVSVSIGGIQLAPSDILYAGAAPGQIVDQLNFRVPQGVGSGNQPLIISVGGIASPPNGYLAIQ